LTPAASAALVEAYIAMRNLGASSLQSADRRITATTRQLESMIRLGEAHAKMRLSQTVDESDVAEAVRLIRSAIKASATDARTGLIDMGLLEGGSASDRRRREDLKRAVLGVVDDDSNVRSGGAARYADLYRRVTEGSSVEIDGAEFQEALRALEQEGKVQITGEGGRRNVRRVTGV
jgi:DNA replication licensing factor MCM4